MVNETEDATANTGETSGDGSSRMKVNPNERTLVEQARAIEKLIEKRGRKVEEIDALDVEIKTERERLRGMLPMLDSAGAVV